MLSLKLVWNYLILQMIHIQSKQSSSNKTLMAIILNYMAQLQAIMGETTPIVAVMYRSVYPLTYE